VSLSCHKDVFGYFWILALLEDSCKDLKERDMQRPEGNPRKDWIEVHGNTGKTG
jgi:hypothetical protein